ncbi:hypothetical protein ZIOFF_004395 [Zingiber officinale]|uniref:CYTH domain-containing protein n=1 Tax=Zingiber officinale TaxID=94328 RepID=A0A8J5IP39_ZINOF|nr:hypothetical protein ZIOFF_004395 [Zingiber officinale]
MRLLKVHRGFPWHHRGVGNHLGLRSRPLASLDRSRHPLLFPYQPPHSIPSPLPPPLSPPQSHPTAEQGDTGLISGSSDDSEVFDILIKLHIQAGSFPLSICWKPRVSILLSCFFLVYSFQLMLILFVLQSNSTLFWLMDQDNSIMDSPQRRHGLLRDQVRLAKRKNSDRYEIVPIQDPLSFEKGFFIVIRACQLLAQKNDGIIVVGVAGPSGAGKSVFTEKVLNFIPSIAVISMDNYNDSSRIIDGNFDDPRLTDYDTLLENIRGLKEGKSVQVPIYDFKSSSCIGYRTVDVPSSRIVFLEGIYALSEKLRPLLDLRVSVTGGVHFDLVKRVLRDIQRAGQEPEEIIHQISETVYPMYKAFIEPDLQTAHIKISNKFNPFTGFQNPTYILKSPRNVPVDQIKSVLSQEHKESTEETYDIYLLPPGEDPEACQSYLRMRNRDGKYNLMFEEWVTDNPFIISPRITFEVSVRLLGGLMALGYSIAAILKRSSHVLYDDKVVVKIDWLEQLNRHYIQVTGMHM